MFAIVRSGSKQYQVSSGSVIQVERLDGKTGQDHVFDDVLMIADGDRITIGTPRVEGAAVYGQIVGDTRKPKITIYKKRQRSTYRRKIGHRQTMTSVRVTDIRAPKETSESVESPTLSRQTQTPQGA